MLTRLLYRRINWSSDCHQLRFREQQSRDKQHFHLGYHLPSALCSATGRRANANARIIYAKFIHATIKCRIQNTRVNESCGCIHPPPPSSSSLLGPCNRLKTRTKPLCNLSNCSTCYFLLSLDVIIHLYFTFPSLAILPYIPSTSYACISP